MDRLAIAPSERTETSGQQSASYLRRFIDTFDSDNVGRTLGLQRKTAEIGVTAEIQTTKTKENTRHGPRNIHHDERGASGGAIGFGIFLTLIGVAYSYTEINYGQAFPNAGAVVAAIGIIFIVVGALISEGSASSGGSGGGSSNRERSSNTWEPKGTYGGSMKDPLADNMKWYQTPSGTRLGSSESDAWRDHNRDR